MAAGVEKAYEAIRQGIIQGVYAPGAHITAQGLAATTGLSRTPVREAMRRLHSEGLIKFIANRGAFVASWSEREIQQTYDLRALLEGFAAGAAARNATEEQIAELRSLALQMRDLVRKAPFNVVEAIAERNSKFHTLVISSASNARLQTLVPMLVEVPLVLNTFKRYSLPELERSATQHLELVDAIAARDEAWARHVMESHILAARHTLLSSIAGDKNGEALAQSA